MRPARDRLPEGGVFFCAILAGFLSILISTVLGLRLDLP
jgi:hypothetical protein